MSDISQAPMSSTRPYLLRAIYDWLVDNDATPHLLVDANHVGVEVPQQFVENGMIVLNVSPNAVRDLELGNEYIMFGARFSGRHHDICVPLPAVQAIYGRENGQGIFLGEAESETDEVLDPPVDEPREPDEKPAETHSKKPVGAPHLTVVK